AQALLQRNFCEVCGKIRSILLSSGEVWHLPARITARINAFAGWQSLSLRESSMPGLLKGIAVFSVAIVAGFQAASAEDLSPTLQKIKESGAITLGYRDASI